MMFSNKTVKTKKSSSQITSNLPRAFTRETISSSKLKEIVVCPEGEDINEWLAVNTVDFYNQVHLLYGTITEYCTPSTCPVMNAGQRFEYHWCDGVKVKKPIKVKHTQYNNVSAPEYVDLLMSHIQSQLDDDTIFPTTINTPFPKSFFPLLKQIYKRLFRVYAHIYHCHFDQVLGLEQEAHMNTSFKHFIYFVSQFGLVESKELAPLEELIDALIGDDNGSNDGNAMIE